MGKNKKKAKQLAKPLNTIGSGFTTNAPVQTAKPVQTVPPATTAKVVQMAPPKAVMTPPTPPPTSTKPVIPSAPASTQKPTSATGNSGVVISVRSGSTGNIHGRIKATSGEYFIHINSGQVPNIGTIVEFEPYEFNGKPCAKITKVTGIDKKITDQHARYSGIIYKLIDPGSILLEEGEDPNVVGITPEGLYVYCIKD